MNALALGAALTRASVHAVVVDSLRVTVHDPDGTQRGSVLVFHDCALLVGFEPGELRGIVRGVLACSCLPVEL